MLAILIRSGIHTDIILCVLCDHRTKGQVKAVAQELINDVNQDVTCYAKLALAQ
jgi:hypothetical protein